MTASVHQAGPTRVTWWLPGGAVPTWVEQTVALLQRSGELVCRVDIGSPDTAAAARPVVPTMGANDAERGADRDADLVLCLHSADLLAQLRAWGAPSADRSAAVESWLLTDGDGQPLCAQRPLLHSITAGDGISLALWRHAEDAGVRDSAGASGALTPWACVRRLHVRASPRYGHGQRRLVPALAQLLRQACVDRRLGVVSVRPTAPPSQIAAAPSHMAAAPPRIAPPPTPGGLSQSKRRALPLLRGAFQAWVQQQHARGMRERWLIGILDLPLPQLLQGGSRPPVRWLAPPPGLGYWADPMAHGQREHEIVCEFFDERRGVGHIERLTLGADDRVQSRTLVPLGDDHLSFPLVVLLDGRQLGMAETSARRECVLHEVDAAGHWRPIATLLPGVAAADPALFAWGGRYWLAYTDIDLGETDNLCLQYADAPEGPWQPHANNPVKLDVTSARMAGGFFTHEGALYRPAQNCLKTYGASVVVHRVLHCTPTAYEEEPVLHLLPDPHSPCPDGLHTLSAWGQHTLVDGKQHVFSPTTLWLKLWRRLRWRKAPKSHLSRMRQKPQTPQTPQKPQTPQDAAAAAGASGPERAT